MLTKLSVEYMIMFFYLLAYHKKNSPGDLKSPGEREILRFLLFKS